MSCYGNEYTSGLKKTGNNAMVAGACVVSLYQVSESDYYVMLIPTSPVNEHMLTSSFLSILLNIFPDYTF